MLHLICCLMIEDERLNFWSCPPQQIYFILAQLISNNISGEKYNNNNNIYEEKDV